MAIDPRNKQHLRQNKTSKVMKIIAEHWREVLNYTRQHPAYQRFARDAEECNSFYDGEGSKPGIYYSSHATVSEYNSPFRIRINRVYEFVNHLEPEIYFKNPIRTVSVRSAIDEDGAQRQVFAELLQEVLNYGTDEHELFLEQRAAIRDALITGRGVLQVRAERLADGTLAVTQDHVPVCDFVMDPDPASLRDVTWMARKRRVAKTLLVREFGDDALKLFSEESNPNELIDYWEIYSKVGFLGGLAHDKISQKDYDRMQEKYGDYVRIILVEKPYYTAAHERDEASTELRSTDQSHALVAPRVLRVDEWPIPFWKESDQRNAWPFTLVDVGPYQKDTVYPISRVKPALGEQRVINWLAMFLLNRTKNASKALVEVNPNISKEELKKLKSSIDMDFIKGMPDGEKMISLVEMNPNSESLIISLNYWMQQFDQRIGLTEIKYFQSTQSRSAQDASIKGQVANRAIDSYASIVERGLSQAARKEGFTWRILGTPEDVGKIVGGFWGDFWEQYDEAMETAYIRDYDVVIEADSARRPNKADKISQLQAIFNVMGQAAAQMQDLETYNYYAFLLFKEMGMPPWQFKPISPPPMPQDLLQQGMLEPGAEEGMQ